MTPDSPSPAETASPAPEPAPAANPLKLIAPVWHTALLVAMLLLVSISGSRSMHALAGRDKLLLYTSTIAWEWFLVLLTWLGIRKRIRMREVVGGRWDKPKDFLRDLMVAAGFWIVSLVVLGAGGKLLGLDQSAKLDDLRRQVAFMLPGTRLELVTWFCLCLTAGFCEEIIFRGYLQRQLAALTRSAFAGVLLSAAVFGASHGYEGGKRMLLIGVYGFLFGVLAWWRKSLRPGMIAHAWHDAITGAILRMHF